MRIALFLAGFATFALLYCVQPLLPVFGQVFRVGAAGASLALSLSTGCLALSILGTTPLAAALGAKRMMAASMILAALCDLACAAAPGWTALLALRTLEGLLLGGVPAVAMAYLSEEAAPAELGSVMGLYVGGTAFGGMAGRVGTALVANLGGDHGSWRLALVAIGSCCLMAALLFVAPRRASGGWAPGAGTSAIPAWSGCS